MKVIKPMRLGVLYRVVEHPSIPILETTLPGIAARCFVTQKDSAGEAFRESAMAPETVHDALKDEHKKKAGGPPKSGTVMGPSRHLTCATTILIGGAPATRLTSSTIQNSTNCPGARIAPSQVKVVLLAP